MPTDISSKNKKTDSLRLSLRQEGKEIGRVWLYFIRNDLHAQPYAYIEDLYVEEPFRGKSFGTKLMQAALEEARKRKCYKVIATSRFEREKVHEFYKKLGFKEYGKEFRMEL